MKKLLQFGAIAMGLTIAGSVSANKLIVGMSSEPTSVDPYFHNLSPNTVVAMNVFDTLAYISTEGYKPRLATSWEQLPDNKIKFNLRKGVKFHDGSDFTANDVVYSACRISRVKNSPSSLARMISEWEDIEVVDDHTIIVQKTSVAPMLVANVASAFFILSDSVAGGGKIDFNKGACDGFKYVETIEFEAGNATIGTGPYTLDEYTKGEKIVYKKFDGYWGNNETGGNQPAQYDTLEIRPIKAGGSRLAALISGDVDVIESPPVQDLPRLEKNPDIRVATSDSSRSIYVMFSMKDETLPDVEGTDGKNPFLDKKIRTALSMAINRELLVDRIMGPLGIPASNIAPIGMFGMDETEPYVYDPKRAKELLAEAGYPNGFTVTLGAPNDRYINDAKLAQAIAQMWTQIGIKTNVTAVTRSLFFGNRNKGMYPVWLAGWGSSLFDGESYVRALSGTVNKQTKSGASNKGLYSNPAIDLLLEKISNEADDAKRWKLVSAAAAIIKEEKNWVATHYQIFPLALHKSVDYTPPAGGERTDFRAFSPAK